MASEGVAAPTERNIGYRSQSRPEMLVFVPSRQDLKVLDIGCGEGSFATSIPNAAEVWGIEPYGPAAAVAATRMHRVFPTLFEQARPELPRGYFDLVVCNDVIEHMTDHDQFLRTIQDYMTSTATIIGSLPNVRHYVNMFDVMVARDWKYEDSGILDRTHFRFFTMRSIRRSLTAAGYAIEEMRGISGGLQLYWNRWKVSQLLFYWLVNILSLGRSSDMRYLQIAFKASRNGQPAATPTT